MLRSTWFRHLIDERRVPEGFRRFGRRIGLQKLHAAMKAWNESAHERPALEPDLKAELIDTFHDDIQLLSHLLKRDLSHWLAA